LALPESSSFAYSLAFRALFRFAVPSKRSWCVPAARANHPTTFACSCKPCVGQGSRQWGPRAVVRADSGRSAAGAQRARCRRPRPGAPEQPRVVHFSQQTRSRGAATLRRLWRRAARSSWAQAHSPRRPAAPPSWSSACRRAPVAVHEALEPLPCQPSQLCRHACDVFACCTERVSRLSVLLPMRL